MHDRLDPRRHFERIPSWHGTVSDGNSRWWWSPAPVAASAGRRPRVRRPRRRGGPAGPRRGRPAGAADDVRRRGRHARSPSRSTSPTPTRSTTPPTGSRSELGPIDVWVNVAFTSVFAPFTEIDAGRVPPGHRGHATSATCTAPWPRCAGCCRATAARSCRSARRWPTAASRCRRAYCGAKHAIQGFHESLRCELLHEQEQRARDDGADAGGEHPAVLLGAVPAARTRRSRCRRSTSPRSPPGGRVRRRPPEAPRVLGRRQHRGARWPPTPSRPACWTATWPGPASAPSRPTSRRTRTSRRTCGSRPTARTAATSAPTAASTTGHDPQRPALGLPAPRPARGRGRGAAAGTVVLARARPPLTPPSGRSPRSRQPTRNGSARDADSDVFGDLSAGRWLIWPAAGERVFGRRGESKAPGCRIPTRE